MLRPDCRRDLWAGFGQSLEQAGSGRQGEPEQRGVPSVLPDEPGEWGRDPQAHTVETIEQSPPKSHAGPPTQTNRGVPGPILFRQEVGHAPDGEDPERQPVEVHRLNVHAIHEEAEGGANPRMPRGAGRQVGSVFDALDGARLELGAMNRGEVFLLTLGEDAPCRYSPARDACGGIWERRRIFPRPSERDARFHPNDEGSKGPSCGAPFVVITTPLCVCVGFSGWNIPMPP